MIILNFLYILLVISNFLVPLHPIFGGLSVGLLNGDHKNRALREPGVPKSGKFLPNIETAS